MKKDKFKCPECGETFLEFRTEINKIKEKHYMQYCCPHCGYVVKQKKSWSQMARIVAIAVTIPTVMLLAVIIAILFAEYPSTSGLFYLIFPIVFPFVVFFILAIYQRKRREKLHKILGENHKEHKHNKKATKANTREELEYKPGDAPLMNEVRKNSIEQIKTQNSEKPKSKASLIPRALKAVLLVSLVVILLIPQIINIFEHRRDSVKKMRETIIEGRAEFYINLIYGYRYGSKKFPLDFSKDDAALLSIYKEESDKMDKEYFGEVIDMDDFSYTSDGDSFRLCIKESLGGKCWERGKQ